MNSVDLYDIEIIDIVGRVHIKKENVSNEVLIKTSDFKEGTYFINIQSDSGIQIYKIVINK